MGKNKLDIINFCKILDVFGEQAAKDTLEDVNTGRVRESVIEKRNMQKDCAKNEF